MSYCGPRFRISVEERDDLWGELHWNTPTESHSPVPDIDVLHRLLNYSEPGKFILFRKNSDSNGILLAVSSIQAVQPAEPTNSIVADEFDDDDDHKPVIPSF